MHRHNNHLCIPPHIVYPTFRCTPFDTLHTLPHIAQTYITHPFTHYVTLHTSHIISHPSTHCTPLHLLHTHSYISDASIHFTRLCAYYMIPHISHIAHRRTIPRMFLFTAHFILHIFHVAPHVSHILTPTHLTPLHFNLTHFTPTHFTIPHISPSHTFYHPPVTLYTFYALTHFM